MGILSETVTYDAVRDRMREREAGLREAERDLVREALFGAIDGARTVEDLRPVLRELVDAVFPQVFDNGDTDE